MQDSKYWLYFDYQNFGDFMVTAVIVNDKENSVRPFKKGIFEFQIDPSLNQFECVMVSMVKLFDYLIENNLKGILYLHHQNKTVLEWLERGHCNPNYSELFDILIGRLKKVYAEGSEVLINNIPAKENIAKKYCKSNRGLSKSTTKHYRKIVLDGMENERTDDNIKDVFMENLAREPKPKVQNDNVIDFSGRNAKKLVNFSNYRI